MTAAGILDKIKQFFNSLGLTGLNIVGLILGAVGTITNALIIIDILPRLILPRKRAPNMKYSLIQAICDCLACFSWCACEFLGRKVTKEKGKTTLIFCALYVSKSAFWAFFAYRSGINVLAAAHFFRRLIFVRVRMPIDTSCGILAANIIFICHAAIAAAIHGLEVQVDKTAGTCNVTRDLVAQYKTWVGPIKVAVVAHVSLMYTFPVTSTMFFYTLMTSALRESHNPVHEKAYQDLKKIYYMDCTIYLVAFFPFICCFFLHHFLTDFDFGPMDPLYKVVFNIAFAYPALYPLAGVYVRRNFNRPLMYGMDFFWSKEKMERTAVKRATEEKVAENLDDQSLFSIKIQ